jgi:FixJ family two-component response regulator
MGAAPIVAIIDSHQGVRDALSSLVSQAGYGIELYASADEFVVRAQVSGAKCLVIDVQLRDLSGIELSQHLSALGLEIPIIFLTSSDDQSLRRQAMEVGCIAYLRKPVEAYWLLDFIAEAVRRI